MLKQKSIQLPLVPVDELKAIIDAMELLKRYGYRVAKVRGPYSSREVVPVTKKVKKGKK